MPDNNATNALQVYRSYRGDVTLLTDIVRCAVRFATPRDLLNFVENWLFVFGEPKRPEKKTSMKSRFAEQYRDFKDIVNDFFHPYNDSEDREPHENLSNSEKQNLSENAVAKNAVAKNAVAPYPVNSAKNPPVDANVPLPLMASNTSQYHAPGAHSRSEQGVVCDCDACIKSQRQHKIFEILRIRNRLDPALLDVPGGYRDMALKIKIGFFR